MLPSTLLLRFYDLLYTRLAWGYDLVAWLVSAGLWYEWVRAALAEVEAGPILEVGCGRGWLLRDAAAHGWPVVGVDWSMQMARYARAHSAQPVARGDGRALPFPDAHFGTLLTTFPAPYVREPRTQQEFARVLRPGGRWLWIDAPTLRAVPQTGLARLLAALAWGRAAEAGDALLRELPHDPQQWQVVVRRVRVGPSSVALRIATRRGAGGSRRPNHD